MRQQVVFDQAKQRTSLSSWISMIVSAVLVTVQLVHNKVSMQRMSRGPKDCQGRSEMNSHRATA
jgi:hypothetical protein